MEVLEVDISHCHFLYEFSHLAYLNLLSLVKKRPMRMVALDLIMILLVPEALTGRTSFGFTIYLHHVGHKWTSENKRSNCSYLDMISMAKELFLKRAASKW